jgi:hypothetical protein
MALPTLAARLSIREADLRRALVTQTGGMYPALLDHPEIDVFLPPSAAPASTSSANRPAWEPLRRSRADCMMNAMGLTSSARTSAPVFPT